MTKHKQKAENMKTHTKLEKQEQTCRINKYHSHKILKCLTKAWVPPFVFNKNLLVEQFHAHIVQCYSSNIVP